MGQTPRGQDPVDSGVGRAPDLVGFVHRSLCTSWADFVESLGIPYPGIKRYRDWTERKLLEAIRR